MTHGGPHSIRSDQRQGRFLLTGRAFALNDGHTLGVTCNILELASEPQLDVVVVGDAREQNRLQVSAPDDPVGRAVTRSGGSAERDSSEFLSGARGHHRNCVGRDNVRSEIFFEAEIDQDAAGIRR